MKIVIDQGNSAAKVAIFNNGNLLDIMHFSPVVSKFDLETIFATQPSIHSGIFCTTAASDAELEAYLATKSVLIFNETTKIPIKNCYRTPKTLGYDRLAAAVCAWDQFKGHDIVVFDLGSAITIDFVSAAGEYLGGNISAGLAMRLNALHHFTGKLPKVDVEPDFELNNLYGTDTASALRLGVVRSIYYEIEGYMAANPNKMFFFTGGDALFFEKQIKKPIFVNCAATLNGLLSILEYNA